LLPESYLKQNRYPWRYRSNNGFISTAMEKHTVFFTEANLPDNHIVNQEYNAFLDKFEKREFNCCGS
jgi:hypothetical protein